MIDLGVAARFYHGIYNSGDHAILMIISYGSFRDTFNNIKMTETSHLYK